MVWQDTKVLHSALEKSRKSCKSHMGSDALYNSLMKARQAVLILILMVMLSACRLIPWLDVSPSPTPTLTSTATRLIRQVPSLTPSLAFYPMCTPPLCAIGTNEVYYCSETCPNGCGTVCATYTPVPKP